MMKRYYDWLLSIRVGRDTVGLIAGYVVVGGTALLLVLIFVSAALEYR